MPSSGNLNLLFGPQPTSSRSVEQVLEDAPHVDVGHSVALPVRVHHLQRVRPDLEVVRLHEVPGDAVAEDGGDPLGEVPSRGSTRLCASTMPMTQSRKASVGRRWMLFWNGYGTKRSCIQTHASRMCSS